MGSWYESLKVKGTDIFSECLVTRDSRDLGHRVSVLRYFAFLVFVHQALFEDLMAVWTWCHSETVDLFWGRNRGTIKAME